MTRQRTGDGFKFTARPRLEVLEDRLALSWTAIPPASITPPFSPTLVTLNRLGDAAGDAWINSEIDYYRFTGPFAQRIAEAGLSPATQLTNFIRAYEEVGCDELVLLPTIADLSEVERLASIVNR